MSRTLQVGRVGLDGMLLSPSSWGVSGDVATVRGSINTDDPERARIVRWQLASAVASRDEAEVPVIWSGDPMVDGIYRLRDADVDMVSLPNGLFGWSGTLERVRDFASPMVDVACPTLYRSGYGVAEGSTAPLVGLPGVERMTWYSTTGSYTQQEFVVRSTATGDVGFVRSEGSGYTSSLRYQARPAHWYDGACRIQVTFDGTTWIDWPGFQVPAGITSWRLCNGLVRVTPSATAGRIDVQHWNGTAWTTAKTYRLTRSEVTYPALGGLTVMRNAPHIASVRTLALYSTEVAFQQTFTVVAGSRWLYGRNAVQLVAGDTAPGGVRRETTEAATSINGGIRATSNDADGNRYLLASVIGDQKDTTNGGLASDPASGDVDYGIGIELAGSSASSTARNTATQQMAEYGRWVAARPRVATL